MAPKKNTPAAALATTVTLAAVVAATQSGGFLHVPREVSEPWVNEGLVEVNFEMADEAGAFATRATEKGILSMNDTSNTETTGTEGQSAEGTTAAVAATASKPTFERIKIAAPPAGRGVSANAGIYPFDDLVAPEGDQVDAFFVPVTAERPEPWSSLASTVSSASARYRKETGVQTYKDKNGADKERKTYDYSRNFRLTRGKHPETGKDGAFISRVK